MKVFVYYNLHKHLWSIRAMEGENKGKVIGHQEYVTLADARPKVSEAGRQRVLREKRKNVHAGIVGYWGEQDRVDNYFESTTLEPFDVSYNPYKNKGFVFVGDRYAGYEWHGSPIVLMNAKAKNKVMAFDIDPY